jgi:hypothetical protein
LSEQPKRLAAVRASDDFHMVGNGFPVQTLFSYQEGERISPFLLLDYAAPADFSPSSERRGVGEHPHRGFETVTIVYQGEVEHGDSAGNHGKIGPGDVQWMTAASGIVHEEWHGRGFTQRGGMMEMVQLWVNLPAKDKMSPPGYQEIPAQRIPTVALAGGGSVRVIAGGFRDARGPAKTFTPIQVFDIRMPAGSRESFDLPDGHTTMVVVLAGKVRLNDSETAGAADLAVFERNGTSIAIETLEDAKLLVLCGAPIEEPVVGYGPFVMNTHEEIRQAIHDYQSGRMGRITAGR